MKTFILAFIIGVSIWTSFVEAAPQYDPYYDPYHTDPYYDPYQTDPYYDPYQSYYNQPNEQYASPAQPNYGRIQPQLRRQQENDGVGFKFEPRKVMNEARDAAQMTRGLADIVDTRGNDFLDLMSTFSSEDSSSINLSDLSRLIRKGADFMESSAATAVRFNSEFGQV